MTPGIYARILRNRLQWEAERYRVFLRSSVKRFSNRKTDRSHSIPFTVGIVTYIIRFSMFQAVLEKLHHAFSDRRIIVAVNGYYKPDLQKEYLARLQEFTSGFPNVLLIPHYQPQALCKLWNEIILSSVTEKIFIVNDDIDISPGFREVFLDSGILEREITLINGSWSHFVISKKIVAQVGWFDERLMGVGGEDWDYEARMAFTGTPLSLSTLRGIRNLSIYTTDFSFGENVERVERKYTKSSSDFLHRKWRVALPDDPDARYVRIWNNYVKPNAGFDTPVFYDFALLENTVPAVNSPV